MKQKSSLLLILFSNLCLYSYAQDSTVHEVDKAIKIAPCLSNNEPRPKGSIVITQYSKSAKEVPITLFFTLDAKVKNPEKFYILKAVKKGLPYKGTMDGKNVVYNIPFEQQDSIILQISNAADKCYNTFVKLILKKDEDTSVPGDIAPLTLSPYGIIATPCDPNTVKGDVVVYDFKESTLLNYRNAIGKKKAFTKAPLKSRFTKLPYVGGGLVFEIENVNPFRFDIKLSDTTILLNQDVTEILTKAYSVPSIPQAIDEDAKAKKTKANFGKAMDELDQALDAKITEMRNAGDFFNPCNYVLQTYTEVSAYFTKYFGYRTGMETVEAFLTRNVKLYFNGETEEKLNNKYTELIAKLYTFRTSAVGNLSYRIPQVKNVDQYLFKLNIAPKANILTSARVSNKEVYVDVLGGFKVDVTTGLFMTELLDDKYVLHGDSSVIKTKAGYTDSIVYNRRNKVVEEKRGKLDFGISSFFHFYPKISANFNLALSLGAGVTINEKPKLRYLGGASLLIGRTNRLALTYGVALGYVNRLSNIYDDQMKAGGPIYISPKETKVEMKSVLRTRAFFSVSYSIPLFKKTEEVKSPAAPKAPEKPATDPKPETPEADGEAKDAKTDKSTPKGDEKATPPKTED